MEVVLLIIYIVVEFRAARRVWGLMIARVHGVHYRLVGLALETFPQA